VFQGIPNCCFAGTSLDGLELLLSDRPEDGPPWISLLMRKRHKANMAQQIAAQAQGVPQPAPGQLQAQADLEALHKLEQHFQRTATHEVDEEETQRFWSQFPVHLYELVEQKSPAWLSLRAMHFFTGSSAFYLLLGGTGTKMQYDEFGLYIPDYRRGAFQKLLDL
jgi:hypothetical protein